MSSGKLKIDWATHEASRYSCENWHYSGILPTGKIVKVGVWEDDSFIGVVLFSRGASPYLGAKFNLGQTEICELTRVALTEHKVEVSRILSIAFKFLRKHCPGIRLIVSFADPEQGHDGGIYRGGNWVYTGRSGDTVEYLVRGRWRHVRGAYATIKGRSEKFKVRTRKGKHRFLMPLDNEMRELVKGFRKEFIKCAGSKDVVASTDQVEEGGSNPTPALPANQKRYRHA